MKKILIISTLQNTIEAFLIPHIKDLEKEGYDVSLACSFTREKNNELKYNKWFNIPFSRNPLSKQNYYAMKNLENIMKTKEFDIVHCHTPIASFIGRYIANKANIKNIIYTAHGFHFFKGASLINWLIYYPMEWLAMRWTDKIITINQEDYERAKKMAGKRAKVYKVNGVGLDFEKFKKENINFTGLKESLEIKKDDFILLSIGELNKNKNQIQTIKAVEKLRNTGEKVKYLLAGEGPNRGALEKYIKEKNLSKEVILLGKVEKKLIPELIQLSDIVISTSIREGLGLNLIEALAGDKPIIATVNRGHKEIIIDKTNGSFVNIGNSKELVNKIFKLKNSRKKIEINIERFQLDNIIRDHQIILSNKNIKKNKNIKPVKKILFMFIMFWLML